MEKVISFKKTNDLIDKLLDSICKELDRQELLYKRKEKINKINGKSN